MLSFVFWFISWRMFVFNAVVFIIPAALVYQPYFAVRFDGLYR
jgi:hypothetical protein